MGDALIGALVAVSVIIFGCCCICLVGMLSHNNQIEIVYVMNHLPRVVVQPSVGSDEPEDPVDFSSNPKSSDISLGS
jgi:hypothetical protein